MTDLIVPVVGNEREQKRAALRCYRSQVPMVSPRLQGWTRDERFSRVPAPNSPALGESVERISWSGSALHVRVALPSWRLARGPLLRVVGERAPGVHRSFVLRLPRHAHVVPILDGAAGRQVGEAIVAGQRHCREIVLPLTCCGPARRWFVKLEQRGVFFDTTGWFETAE